MRVIRYHPKCTMAFQIFSRNFNRQNWGGNEAANKLGEIVQVAG